MSLPLFHVDAFIAKPFPDNPAAVCPLENWLDDEMLRAVAAENNLSETAYRVPRGDDCELRWFMPRCRIGRLRHTIEDGKTHSKERDESNGETRYEYHDRLAGGRWWRRTTACP